MLTKLLELTFYNYTTNYQMINLHSKKEIPFLSFASFNFFSNLDIKHQIKFIFHLMLNYIRKDNEKYRNNVMKNKFSMCFFLTLKKIGCSLSNLKWSIRWSLEVQDGNHLVATKYFFVIPLTFQQFGGHQVFLCSPPYSPTI